jgi:hypothetical protein
VLNGASERERAIRKAYRILTGKPKGRDHLGDRCRWEVSYKKIGFEDVN